MLALSQLTPFLFPKIHAEEISGNNGYVELSFCAKKLDDKVRNDVVLFFIKKHLKKNLRHELLSRVCIQCVLALKDT